MEEITCDEFYTSCIYQGKEDTKREYGRTHRYYRHFCLSGGIYNDKTCPHAMIGGSRLIPKKKKMTRNSVVRVYKVEPVYRDLIKQ